MTGKEIQRWADGHQYLSEPMPEGKGLSVTLLNATPDPLGSLAALCGIYKGRVVRSLREVSDEDRRASLDDMSKTTLNGPLAGVHFHFVLEGVSRSFTHQAVRDNFSFIAQESLRFAVKEDWAAEVPLPPHLAGLREDHPQVRIWKKAMNAAEDAYGALVNNGMPAEEARELLPHAVTTRYHWTPSLRTLLAEAGKRTCTQAQFHWKQVFAQIAKALRKYRTQGSFGTPWSDKWQFELIANMLRPNCFQTGSCGFMAAFDRGCTIRERVEAFGSVGVPSSEWGKNYDPENAYADGPPMSGQVFGPPYIRAIGNHEWAADPGAARKPVL